MAKKIPQDNRCFNHVFMYGVDVILFQELGFINALELKLLDPDYSKYDRYLPEVFYSFEDMDERIELGERIQDLERHDCLYRFDVMLGGDILECFALPLELKKMQVNHETAAEQHVMTRENCFQMCEDVLSPPRSEDGVVSSISNEEQIWRLSCVCYLLLKKDWGKDLDGRRQLLQQDFLKTLDAVPETIYREAKEDAHACITNVVDDLPAFLKEEKLSEFEELLLERENKRSFAIRKNCQKLLKVVDRHFDPKKETLSSKEISDRMLHLMALVDTVVLYNPYLKLEEKTALANELDIFCIGERRNTISLPKLQMENRNIRIWLFNQGRERGE